MKRILVAMMALCLVLPAAVRAEDRPVVTPVKDEAAAARGGDQVRQKLAEEVLGLMDVQKSIESSLEFVKQMQTAQLAKAGLGGLSPAQKAAQAKVMDVLAQEMSWDKVKDDYIRMYANAFTEEELKGLVEFYKSPAGRALVEKTPELTKQSMEMSQQRMMQVLPKLQALMGQIEPEGRDFPIYPPETEPDESEMSE